MGENSGIGWTGNTFNPWIVCTKLGPECDNCYAERDFGNRFGLKWGKGEPRKKTSEANWRKVYQWDRKAAASGERVRVFCASLADWADPEVPREWRDELFALIATTPNLDWLLLTKRPRVAHDYLTDPEMPERVRQVIVAQFGPFSRNSAAMISAPVFPLPNVGIGVSAGVQRSAEVNIPWLLRTPAAMRFVSAEPMLEQIDLRNLEIRDGLFLDALTGMQFARLGTGLSVPMSAEPLLPALDWVICGGESGPKARQMRPEWPRLLLAQCLQTSRAFFFKQWGEWCPFGAEPIELRLQDYQERDGMYRIGTKAAGNLLDGHTWEQLPTWHREAA